MAAILHERFASVRRGYPEEMADRPVLIVGDVQGDYERLEDALSRYPADEVDTVFLGDFYQGGRLGAAGGHRSARIAMERSNSRSILGNHDLFLLAMLEMERGVDIGWRNAHGTRLADLFVSRRGDAADVRATATDPELEAWIRTRPLMLLLDDGTLVQHTDHDNIADLGGTIDEVNTAARDALAEPGGLQRLLPYTIGRHAFDEPHRLDAHLRRYGARRVVHGHTPHWHDHPDSRHDGRAVGFDGRFSRYWAREPGEANGPVEATVALLPPLPVRAR
jgi:hypothetical protein